MRLGILSAMDLSFLQYDPSRRNFLKGAFGGSFLLGVGALLPTGCYAYPAVGETTYTSLDAKTAAIVNAIADTIVADGSGKLPVPSTLGIAKRIDAMVSGLHPDVRQQTLMLFQLMEHTPVLFGHFGRFTKLPPAEQKASLAGWENSSIGLRKMAFQALKMFVYVNYYSYTETWDVLGYDGPWFGRFDIPHYEPPLAKYTEKDPL